MKDAVFRAPAPDAASYLPGYKSTFMASGSVLCCGGGCFGAVVEEPLRMEPAGKFSLAEGRLPRRKTDFEAETAVC